jgi:hypothetical protein
MGISDESEVEFLVQALKRESSCPNSSHIQDRDKYRIQLPTIRMAVIYLTV